MIFKLVYYFILVISMGIDIQIRLNVW